MIADVAVQKADPAPLAFAFRHWGGFPDEVTVSVIDADGITHTPVRDDARHPDTGFLLEIRVSLDPGWAYPVRVMVDRAEEHPASSEETSG